MLLYKKIIDTCTLLPAPTPSTSSLKCSKMTVLLGSFENEVNKFVTLCASAFSPMNSYLLHTRVWILNATSMLFYVFGWIQLLVISRIVKITNIEVKERGPGWSKLNNNSSHCMTIKVHQNHDRYYSEAKLFLEIKHIWFYY